MFLSRPALQLSYEEKARLPIKKFAFLCTKETRVLLADKVLNHITFGFLSVLAGR